MSGNRVVPNLDVSSQAATGAAAPTYRQPGFEVRYVPVRGYSGLSSPLYCRGCGVRRPLHLPQCKAMIDGYEVR